MDTGTTLASLNLFTLIAVLVVALGGAFLFFRKAKNRHPMGEHEGLHTNLDKAARQDDPPRARDAR